MNLLTCVTWVEDFREKIPLDDKTHIQQQQQQQQARIQ